MTAGTIEIVKVKFDNVAEAVVVAAHKKSAADIKRLHPGLISSVLIKVDESTYIDVLSWTSREAAQAALDGGDDIPAFGEWSKLTEELVSFDMADVVSVLES